MRQAVMLMAAAGCAAVAILCGKEPETGWSSVVLSVVFAGSAGALLVGAAG